MVVLNSVCSFNYTLLCILDLWMDLSDVIQGVTSTKLKDSVFELKDVKWCYCCYSAQSFYSHVSVRQVLKIVSTDTLVGVGRQDRPAVIQTP